MEIVLGQRVDEGYILAIRSVSIRDGEIDESTYDAEETDRRKTAAQDRFDRLAERPPADNESEK